MPRKKTLKFAVCGYGGAFSMGKLHSDQLHQTGRAELVAVCDVDRSRLEAAEKDFPGINTYTSLGRLLANSDAEMVIIITPHNTHAKLAVQALKAGRHVVVEKPMCITYAQARAMMQAAKNARRMLSVYHNRRWDADYVTLKKIINSGKIGEVFSVRCHMASFGMKTDWWRSDKKISGGCLYDWGAHMVDWTLGLVPSKVDSVTGFSQKLVWKQATNEDEARALIRFRNGAVGDVMVSHIRDARNEPTWRIMGTKGDICCGSNLQVATKRKGRLVIEYVPFEKTDWAAYHENVVAHILDQRKLEVTAKSAARAIAVIEAQAKSAKTGKSVKVPGE